MPRKQYCLKSPKDIFKGRGKYLGNWLVLCYVESKTYLKLDHVVVLALIPRIIYN